MSDYERVLCKDVDKLSDAINRVLDELYTYNGEKVVAYEHTLHDAVRALEELSIKRRETCKQTYHLPRPTRKYWYHLLWASRGELQEENAGCKTEHIAIYYKGALVGALREWLITLKKENQTNDSNQRLRRNRRQND